MIPRFRCMEDNHSLWLYKREIFASLRAKGHTKVWFICFDCQKQSMYFEPSDYKIKVARLHEEHRPKLPYLGEDDVYYVARPEKAKKKK